MLSRREFVAGAAALPFALRAMAEPEPAPRWVLLGSNLGKGIYRASWNSETGELGAPELAIASDRPTYLAKHPTLPIVYAANAMNGSKAAVSSFVLLQPGARLQALNSVSSLGDGPCFVSVDQTGRSAFVANYFGGTVTAYGLGPHNGSLRAAQSGFDCRNNPACGAPGPMKARQDAAHMHCTTVSPDNKFVLACNLGEDAIEVFSITPGPISSNILGVPMRVAARAGSGPRHVAFHPNGRWVYCIHELDCTIDVYDWSAGTLTLRKNSTISTLAKGVPLGVNTACEIVVSDDGRFVYACTRFVNEITVYRVNAATGKLTEQQRLSCGGQIPRYFAFDPSRRWLVCTNQGTGVAGSGNITVFAHDTATGKLDETPKTFAAETPMFVMWV